MQNGFAHAVITEDSDLIVFGCEKVNIFYVGYLLSLVEFDQYLQFNFIFY
jgi:5'-3' exonuclease